MFARLRCAAVGLDAVIFDWGGTLSVWVDVDMLDMWRLAAEHLARHGGLTGESVDELTERLVAAEAHFWHTVGTDQRSRTLADLLVQASSEVGLDITDAVLEEAALRHLDAWTPHVRHDPDAAPMLRALKDRGLAVGLLSNTHWPRDWHEHFLERDGLAEHIDVRVYSCELPVVKPHPDAFGAVLDGLGVRPDRAVFVGDRLLDDIHGAKGVGMRAVWRPGSVVPEYDAQPDAVIRSLPELLALVDGWRAG